MVSVLPHTDVRYTQTRLWIGTIIQGSHMEKLTIALAAFGLVLLVVYLLFPDLKVFFAFALKWLTVLAALVAVDVVAEIWVFEALEWNGTDKNDWFFMLWWILVLAWFIRGVQQARMVMVAARRP
jgi:hypothetical protein